APTLAGLEGGETRWHVMVEGSNDQPELEDTFRIGYALGQAAVGASSWDADWPDSSEGPRAGAQPPSCFDGSTCTGTRTSLREPFLLPRAGPRFVIAAARETAMGSEVFALVARNEAVSPSMGVSFDDDDVVLAPEADPACLSLRDPALAPRGASPGDGLWLFYTCERVGPDAIHAVPLETVDGIRVPEGATPASVIAPSTIGAFGRDGVSGPEPIVDVVDAGENAVVRLWFLARSNVAGTSVGLAVGEAPIGAGWDALPVLQAYPANPVLEASAFAGCEGCTLVGFGVAQDPDPTRRGRLRFLVARRVPRDGGGRRFELVPFEQPWVLNR
ncbi:MAG: hypothetical protein AAGH15_13575, partial [Myxococcota bacterium]